MKNHELARGYLFETAEKVLSSFEKEGLRGIIELKFLLISL